MSSRPHAAARLTTESTMTQLAPDAADRSTVPKAQAELGGIG